MKTKNILIILSIMLLIANVSAFAVSSQYWEENPITMIPGEEKEIEIVLQNMAGTEDIYAQASITEASEIAQIVDTSKEYLIKAGDKTSVKVLITIPKKDALSKYNLILSFKTSEEGSGSFGIGNSIEREIPISVITKPTIINETSKTWIISILAVALIIFIILFFKKNKKKKKK